MIPPHRILDDWLRRGRPEPMPEAVERHLQQCQECRAFLEREDELIELLPCPTKPLSPSSHGAIRFRLQAAARQKVRTSGRPRRWAVAAAMLTTFTVCVAWAGLHGSPLSLMRSALNDGAPMSPPKPDTPSEIDGSASGVEPPTPASPQAHRAAVTRVTPSTYPKYPKQERPEPRPQLSASIASSSSLAAEAPSVAIDQSTGAEHDQRTAPKRASTEDRKTLDQRFVRGWQLYQDARYDAAAFAFDELIRANEAADRASDLLYWSAHAHMNAGRPKVAIERLRRLLREHARAWHSAAARDLLEQLDAEVE